MHRIYLEFAQGKGVKGISRQLFSDILDKHKVSIHTPRKDQCDLCGSHAVGNTNQEEYEDHILKKDEARLAKNEAKDKCNKNTAVITMDAQSVLLAPKLMASAIYECFQN